MCLIVYKKRGVAMPSNELMKEWWHYNSAGAGYAVKLPGPMATINFKKGFEDLDIFERELKQFDCRDLLVLHFRRCPTGFTENHTHPFRCHVNNGQGINELHGINSRALVFSSGRAFPDQDSHYTSGVRLAHALSAWEVERFIDNAGFREFLKDWANRARVKLLFLINGRVYRMGRFYQLNGGLLVSNLRYCLCGGCANYGFGCAGVSEENNGKRPDCYERERPE